MKPYYEQDGITIYHGDSREVLPLLCTDAIDAVVTDPPYGLGNKMQGGTWGAAQKYADMRKWDREAASGVVDLLRFGPAIIWGGNYFVLPPSRGWLVWYKRDSVPSAADVEMAWTSLDMNARLIDQTIAATNAERIGHPTQKPLRVMQWSLSFLPDATTILDPYMGSGTTLLAAKMRGLAAVGIEKEEKYAEIAAKRLAQGVLQF